MDLPDKVIVPGPVATPMVIEDYARYMGGRVVVLDIEAAAVLWNSDHRGELDESAWRQWKWETDVNEREYLIELMGKCIATALGVTE